LLAWLSFALLTAMMNPALVGADYWQAVRDRAQGNPAVTLFLVLCCAGVLLGVGIMVRALIGARRQDAEPPAVPDTVT
jgi:hypothetical protein